MMTNCTLWLPRLTCFFPALVVEVGRLDEEEEEEEEGAGVWTLGIGVLVVDINCWLP